MKDKILKLKNNKDYYILEEISFNNKKYILATEYNSEKNKINEDNLVIMEIKIINDKLIATEINNDLEAEKVTLLFKEKIQKIKE